MRSIGDSAYLGRGAPLEQKLTFLRRYLRVVRNTADSEMYYPEKATLSLPEFAEFYFRDRTLSHLTLDERCELATNNLFLTYLDKSIPLLNMDSFTNEDILCPDAIAEYLPKFYFIARYAKSYTKSSKSTTEFFTTYRPKIDRHMRRILKFV